MLDILSKNSRHPEVWAGMEYTVNRVNDDFLNQMQFNGHDTREEDIAMFASLGVKKIRYPLLWELTAPDSPNFADWSWGDRRLHLLRENGVTPIIGLVHHGSGPKHTNLAKPCFAEGLAQYAKAVAKRYPWLEYFTPVNEPLTTARFSGLYGHWYPHGKDNYTFALTLIHQCKATVLAMRAIREIIPHAKLVQTEDLGKTYSTPLLAYQADLENERRWLSLDLLTGNLTPEHIMWRYFVEYGIPETELQWFRQNQCPPDVIGINHYPTSERYLDENLENYPTWSHGTNGIHQYADVDALRVKHDQPGGLYSGHETLLQEAWERFRLPLAITEAHINGGREEQLQWFKHVWDSCVKLRRNGVNLVGVTAWSLLGTYDWVNLVTRVEGFYEPGVFDVRGPEPRPTALAKMLTCLARGKEYSNPLFHLPGWWQRPNRFFYPLSEGSEDFGVTIQKEANWLGRGNKAVWWSNWDSVSETDIIPESIGINEKETQNLINLIQPILIVGATGTLGSAFARICGDRHIPYRLIGKKQMNITDPFSIERAINYYNPWAVVNAASYSQVDEAEQDAENCYLVNTHGAMLLAATCHKRNIPYLIFSSDIVFDGQKQKPYVENDLVNPLNVYGKSKALAEKYVLDMNPEALIVRTSSLFSPWEKPDFLKKSTSHIHKGNKYAIADNIMVSPTYVPDLVHACLDLIMDEEKGIWHLTNEGQITYADFIKKVAEHTELKLYYTPDFKNHKSPLAAVRPKFSALTSQRGQLLPKLDDAIFRYCQRINLMANVPVI